MEVKNFQTEWGGKTLSIETGKIAQQANASCVVRYGDTVILATATMGSEARRGIDFFPLQVEYDEKFYAAGKIKSSRFMKREGRPSDEAVLTGRMIDRSIRPLFPQDVRHEVQCVIECLSIDMENKSDIIGMVGVCAALTISDIPWNGPMGGIRVGRIGGELVANPTFAQQAESDLDVIVAGTPEKALMIEANGKEISEDDMYRAIRFGQENLQPIMKLLEEMRAAIGKTKRANEELMGTDPDETPEQRQAAEDIRRQAKEFLEARFGEALFSGAKASKMDRRAALDKLSDELNDHLKAAGLDKDRRAIGLASFDDVVDVAVSRAILDREQRVDGRKLDELRSLYCEVGLLPRTHGTGLFNRGETQVLSIVTLGSVGDVQTIDGMDYVGKKSYMHHYNFPPYSVGETGRVANPGRREIGHGGLAERALLPVLPEKDKFPYTIRVVSEVLGSNGSSSQASICGSTLALMDAGVPLKRPVAGIAMGLSSDGTGRYKILTDLQDLEDGDGGMDFKIGGTREGITTIQLDTKTDGLIAEIIEKTLKQGRAARLQILDSIEACIPTPRAELSPYAPRIVSFKINPEKIRDVIGPGGKIINEIIDATGVKIDIEDDGTVNVCSADAKQLEVAVEWIHGLTREVVAGELFKNAKVTRIMDFGAFVEVLPNQEGLVHISELAPWRVNKVTDMVKIGDIIPVKCVAIDELGRINLSHKQAKKDLGEEQIMPEGYKSDAPSSGGFRRPGGDDRRGGGGFRN